MVVGGGRMIPPAAPPGVALTSVVDNENEGHDVDPNALRHCRQRPGACERLDGAENACDAASVQPSGQISGSTVARPAIRTTSRAATNRRTSSVYSQSRGLRGRGPASRRRARQESTRARAGTTLQKSPRAHGCPTRCRSRRQRWRAPPTARSPQFRGVAARGTPAAVRHRRTTPRRWPSRRIVVSEGRIRAAPRTGCRPDFQRGHREGPRRCRRSTPSPR